MIQKNEEKLKTYVSGMGRLGQRVEVVKFVCCLIDVPYLQRLWEFFIS